MNNSILLDSEKKKKNNRHLRGVYVGECVCKQTSSANCKTPFYGYKFLRVMGQMGLCNNREMGLPFRNVQEAHILL